MRRTRWRRQRRGVAPVIETVLLVGITLVAAVILYSLRPPIPSAPLHLDTYASTIANEPAWGDGSECREVDGVQSCQSLPAIAIVFVDPPPIPVSELQFVFLCNNSVYITATLEQMEWVPGSSGTVQSGPQITSCGTFTPPKSMWNRVAFFDQVSPGTLVLLPGDELVFYAHTFLTFKDDDFHGAPEFCYSIPNSCSINLYYTGVPSSLTFSLDLYGFSIA